MTSTDVDLRALQDRMRILDTVHAYSDHVDRADIDSLVDLFTEDAVFDYGHGTRFTGRDALRELFLDRLGRYAATNHHCSTERVLSYDGTRAETIVYVYAFHEDAVNELHVHVWGRYEDTMVRQDDTWRIAERRVRVAGVETVPAGALPERFERYSRTALPTP